MSMKQYQSQFSGDEAKILNLRPCYLSLCLAVLITTGFSSNSFAQENVSVSTSLPKITVYAEHEDQAPVS